MAGYYLFLLALLLALGILFRDGFVFTLVYLFTGVYLLIRWWAGRAGDGLVLTRSFTPRAFPGERVKVRLKLENNSRLPLVWARVQESLPNELSRGRSFQEVISLAPGAQAQLEYQMFPRRRGYHRVGPTQVQYGDVLGLFKERELSWPEAHLIVYPEVIQLGEIGLPSWSPLGELRAALPLFPDPARIRGKRDYIPGDSLRWVDWKTSAARGALQVRVQDPSIAVQAHIFLNFHEADYRPRDRPTVSELAVVIAASLANWVAHHKAAIGLVTNAHDPMDSEHPFTPVGAAFGKGGLMRVLESLARVRLGAGEAFEALVRREGWQLPWGATLVLVTPSAGQALFDEIQLIQRRGMHVLLVLCGPVPASVEIRRRAHALGVPCSYIQRRTDLEGWR